MNRKSPESKYPGVSYYKNTNRFVARITVNREQIYIGTFKTPEDAHAAYIDAKKRWICALQMNNPYKNVKLSEEQWDEILGKFIIESLPRDEQLSVWEKIKDLTPVESSNSLHAVVAIFQHENVEYECAWGISQQEDAPCTIGIRKPRR